MDKCPCGSGLNYCDCCGQYIEAALPAPTPEALMRSRYTAYTLNNRDYLLATMKGKALKKHQPSHSDEASDEIQWEGLQVLSHEMKSPNKGYVSFEASYSVKNATRTLAEKSEFQKIAGKWFYVDGKFINPRGKLASPIPKRNDPCPCQSGKKFKQCCGQETIK